MAKASKPSGKSAPAPKSGGKSSSKMVSGKASYGSGKKC